MGARKGKYADVTANLPRLQTLEPERQEIVNAVKADIVTSPLDEALATQNEATLWEAVAAMDGIFEAATPLLRRLTAPDPKSAHLAGAYALLRVVLDDHVNRWRSGLQLVLDAYEQLMLSRMEADGLASMRLTDGSSVSTHDEPYASVKDAEALRRWCLTPNDSCYRCGRPGSVHTVRHDGVVTELLCRDGQKFVQGGGELANRLSLPWGTVNALNKERALAGEEPTPGVELMSRQVVRLSKA